MCSTILAAGAGDVDDTVHAGVRAIFRTAMAHTLGNVDEIVTAKASRMGRATPSRQRRRPWGRTLTTGSSS